MGDSYNDRIEMRAFCDLLFDAFQFKQQKLMKNPKFMLNDFSDFKKGDTKVNFSLAIVRDKIEHPSYSKIFEEIMKLIAKSKQYGCTKDFSKASESMAHSLLMPNQLDKIKDGLTEIIAYIFTTLESKDDLVSVSGQSLAEVDAESQELTVKIQSELNDERRVQIA